MGLGSVIGGVASGIGGILGSSAASSASKQQANAAQWQLALQATLASQARADESPYMNVGKGAIGSLGSLYGINADGTTTPLTQAQIDANNKTFQQSPDYSFAFNQGLQAVDRSQAAQGHLNSGGAVKAATEFGQGLASQQYGNYYNRLLSLGQIGQSAAAGTASNTLASSNQMSNSIGNLGSAQASGTVGSANSALGALNGIGTYAMLGSSSYGGSGGGGLGNALGSLFGLNNNPFAGGGL